MGIGPRVGQGSAVRASTHQRPRRDAGRQAGFSQRVRKRRCLIPADGFYEWKKGDGKTRQAFYIRMLKDRPFAFAGLWESWKGSESSAIESCTIITTAANSRLAELHDRMPVILHEEDYDRWLDPTLDDPALLQSLLAPYPSEEMTFHPVSPFVNSPRNDGPTCLERVAG